MDLQANHASSLNAREGVRKLKECQNASERAMITFCHYDASLWMLA